ncbi:MAG: hypothetical protein CL763_02610 [Chloroflexi bacterium]|nr:hypothetical protein [Chloroflexota bacterium]
MPHRVGLHMSLGAGLTRQESLDFVLRAEALGYESIWFGESWGYDAFTTLTWVASHAKKIRLGTHISTIFSRTPAMTAQSAFSLNEIANGRLTLGIGTSGPLVVQNWHGVEWGSPLKRTREYVEIIRLALSGRRVNYNGDLYKLKGFKLRDLEGAVKIPIMIASIGPQNIQLTGEIADGWLPIFLRRDSIDQCKNLIQEGAALTHKKLDNFEIAPSVLSAVSDNPSHARNMVKAHIAFYIGGMGDFYNNMMNRFGWATEATDIRAAWDKPDRSGRISARDSVTNEMVDQTSVTGDAKYAKEQLINLIDAGVTLPILMFPFGSDKKVLSDTIEALAPKRT